MSEAALRHLLWVRCHQAREALQAADLLLRDGNFPLVVLDLVLNPAAELRRIPQNNWYRLQRLVEPAPTAFLVFTAPADDQQRAGKLALENLWTLPQLEEPTAELAGMLRFRARRLQPNEWRNDRVLSRTDEDVCRALSAGFCVAGGFAAQAGISSATGRAAR